MVEVGEVSTMASPSHLGSPARTGALEGGLGSAGGNISEFCLHRPQKHI